MNKKLILPGVLVLLGLVLRFFFTGVGYIAYAMFFAAALIAITRFCKKAWIKRAVCILTALGLAYLIVIEVPIVGAASGDGDKEYDYIIVLGAAVHGDTPSLSLVERMSAARDYMQAHPQTIAIVSGGQGSDENVSEAAAMTAWLTDNGIDKSRIIAEDKATSTLENLEYSFNIIRQRGDDPNDSCAVVTSEYHIYRAKLLAQSLDVSVGSVAARTTYVPIMINYFIREAFGVTYQLIFC
mgnify:FL=1